MKITWYGTASILLESEGERLLFDPFVELAGASNPNSLEDFVQETDICITHGHVDHLFFIPEILEQADATVFATRAVMNTLEGWVEDTGCLVEVEPGYSWRQGNMIRHCLMVRKKLTEKRAVMRNVRLAQKTENAVRASVIRANAGKMRKNIMRKKLANYTGIFTEPQAALGTVMKKIIT